MNTIKLTLPVAIDSVGRALHTKELIAKLTKVEELEEEKKQGVREANANIGAVKQEIAAHRAALEHNVEQREVTCYERRTGHNTVEIVRLDNEEVVRVRPLSDTEREAEEAARQEPLFKGDAAAPKPAHLALLDGGKPDADVVPFKKPDEPVVEEIVSSVGDVVAHMPDDDPEPDPVAEMMAHAAESPEPLVVDEARFLGETTQDAVDEAHGSSPGYTPNPDDDDVSLDVATSEPPADAPVTEHRNPPAVVDAEDFGAEPAAPSKPKRPRKKKTDTEPAS
jgi:hypothetical protein